MDEPSPSQWRQVQAKDSFPFRCHPEVSCFLTCCSNVHLVLYPYDVLRLKQRTGMHSADFLAQYVQLCAGSHPYFPGVKLRLKDQEGHPCPFLEENGCGVYQDRPSACRTYPLERGVGRRHTGSGLSARYFLTKHPWWREFRRCHRVAPRRAGNERGP